MKKKLYRHHTGYTGNLKEIPVALLMEKDPEKLIRRCVKGMLPKNTMRNDYLKKITVFRDASHDLFHLGLPQFGAVERLDYNELLGASFVDESKIELTVGGQEELDNR